MEAQLFPTMEIIVTIIAAEPIEDSRLLPMVVAIAITGLREDPLWQKSTIQMTIGRILWVGGSGRGEIHIWAGQCTIAHDRDVWKNNLNISGGVNEQQELQIYLLFLIDRHWRTAGETASREPFPYAYSTPPTIH